MCKSIDENGSGTCYFRIERDSDLETEPSENVFALTDIAMQLGNPEYRPAIREVDTYVHSKTI